ncbi:MAG: c-type cytochrome [Chloroflexota bacterium]
MNARKLLVLGMLVTLTLLIAACGGDPAAESSDVEPEATAVESDATATSIPAEPTATEEAVEPTATTEMVEATATAEPTATSEASDADAGSEEGEAVSAGDPEAGEQHFSEVCAACHGPGGEGIEGLGKDLTTSEFVAGLSDEELLAFIQEGRPVDHPDNTTGVAMPPRGGNPDFSDEQLLDIIAHIRTLQEQ